MADEEVLIATLLERFDSLGGFMQSEYEAAAVHYGDSEDNLAMGHMLTYLNYNTTLVRAVETYFTDSEIWTDLAILLAWLRAATAQESEFVGA